MDRGAVGGLSQCEYAADVRRTAQWLERNRARLPRHIFWLESPPQRIIAGRDALPIVQLSGSDSGRWRNVIAHALLRRHAPSIQVLRIEELMMGRASSHIDIAHWCIDSMTFEEAVSALLTQVHVHVHTTRRSSSNRPRSSRCDEMRHIPARVPPRMSALEALELHGMSKRNGLTNPREGRI